MKSVYKIRMRVKLETKDFIVTERLSNAKKPVDTEEQADLKELVDGVKEPVDIEELIEREELIVIC